ALSSLCTTRSLVALSHLRRFLPSFPTRRSSDLMINKPLTLLIFKSFLLVISYHHKHFLYHAHCVFLDLFGSCFSVVDLRLFSPSAALSHPTTSSYLERLSPILHS